jgi:S-adenosylmethionine:tRNA ribosyltransferase-isomerase
MRIADFNYSFPEDLIAKRPLADRSSSRLFVMHRDGTAEHKRFSDLPAYLHSGDMLLMNNTKVFPARLTGFKKNGGKVEILLVKEKGDNLWEVLSKGRFSGLLRISDEVEVELFEGKIALFRCAGNIRHLVWKYGGMPLPPYIRRLPDEKDKRAYQTVYAKHEGSIAAPTAGLHFSGSLLREIVSKGITLRELTLHVGTGTFSPIRTENLEEHCMESEHFEIEETLIYEIMKIRASGRKVICVGTTTTRAIEGYMSGRYRNGSNHSSPEELHNSKIIRGSTDIFIYPGYAFKAVDSLITNFHLPGSTPLMLVSALAGWKRIASSYEEAVANKYRFLSYGDAMLIL